MTPDTFQHCTPSQMDRDSFVHTFGTIYEHSPWIAEQAFDQGIGPQHDHIATLHRLMAETVLQADRHTQLALINAHPQLAPRAALSSTLTAASTAEQASAGLQACSATELDSLQTLNAAYQARFNFPFIMAVKGCTPRQIIAAMEQRLHNTPEQEFALALLQINTIARLRLAEL